MRIDGYEYEIGKYYEFSNTGNEWFCHPLAVVLPRDSHKFITAGGKTFKYIREISKDALGTNRRARDEISIYETKQDAYIALIDSDTFDLFHWEQIEDGIDSQVVRWMCQHDATPEQAAEHFGVA